MLKPYIAKVINRQNLTAAEAEAAMRIIMTGQATQAQIGGLPGGLRMKGETVEEITGSARAMRAQASPRALSAQRRSLLDTAGTGGDGAHTFNISTAAAFVIAGAGRKVAKHGNRAASSQCGSADVLAALGVNLDLTSRAGGSLHRPGGHRFPVCPEVSPGHETRHRPAARAGPAHHLQPARPADQPGRSDPPVDRRLRPAP